MKNSLIVIVLLMGLALPSCKENQNSLEIPKEVVKTPKIEQVEEFKFDPEKASKLGADEYGMKKYIMALLKIGPNRTMPQDEADILTTEHLKNISRLASEGKLVLAGPFLDEGELKGIYVFDVETIEEAEVLAGTDPAIMAGTLAMEFKPWYSSAVLTEINDLHKTVSAKDPWNN